MQFVIVATDAPAPDTAERRLAARATHMEGLKRFKAEGRIMDGGAILDETGQMVGSVLLCDFGSREELDAYLAEEIFAREKIWGHIEVHSFRRVDWTALMAKSG